MNNVFGKAGWILATFVFLFNSQEGWSNKKKEVVNKGDVVSILYTGKLEDGTVFEETAEKEPFRFKVGEGQALIGLDKGLIGLKLNELKKLTLKPEEGYGLWKKELVYSVKRSAFPKNFNPIKGRFVLVHDKKTEKPAYAKIIEVKETEILLDFNHPMAGKTLIFEVKVIAIE